LLGSSRQNYLRRLVPTAGINADREVTGGAGAPSVFLLDTDHEITSGAGISSSLLLDTDHEHDWSKIKIRGSNIYNIKYINFSNIKNTKANIS
jgi:hypothetical protein